MAQAKTLNKTELKQLLDVQIRAVVIHCVTAPCFYLRTCVVYVLEK
jgi:hypothetical protein